MTSRNLELPCVVFRDEWRVACKQPLSKKMELARLAGPGRWLISGLLMAMLPKCLGCVAGYIALAAGIGLAGPELCGGAADDAGLWTGSVMPFLLLGLLAATWRRRALRDRPVCRPGKGNLASEIFAAPAVRNETDGSLSN